MKKRYQSVFQQGIGMILCFVALSGCSSTGNAGKQAAKEDISVTDLTVFAAASMTESMMEIAEQYQNVAPKVHIVYNFDSSGTLKTQIEQGADCDLFISASQKAMDQLDVTADSTVNTQGLDLIAQETRCNLLQNKVVLIVPKDANTNITSFEDVVTDRVSLLAMGNADVPVGQYAQEVFENMGVWDTLKNEEKITFATNVKEVTTQVAQSAVDCGVVYETDAATEPDVKVVAQAGENLYKPAIYPVAVLKNAKNVQTAKDFLEYLKTDACATVFKKVGFTVLSEH